MAKLSGIIGAIVKHVVQARFEADKYSAAISAEYEKDKILRYFPVPRAEISQLTFQLKFGIDKVDHASSDPDIIVEQGKLKELGEDMISTVTVVAGIKNYTWTQVDLKSKDSQLLESN